MNTPVKEHPIFKAHQRMADATESIRTCRRSRLRHHVRKRARMKSAL